MSDRIPIPQFDREVSPDEAIKRASEAGQKYLQVSVEYLTDIVRENERLQEKIDWIAALLRDDDADAALKEAEGK